jgi:hypothetical protein
MKQLEMNVIFSLNSWGLNGIFFVYPESSGFGYCFKLKYSPLIHKYQFPVSVSFFRMYILLSDAFTLK